jgi:hypothetical protein
MDLSDRARGLLRAAACPTPWSLDISLPGADPASLAALRALEAGLFEVTGRRGLPVVGNVAFGHNAAFDPNEPLVVEGPDDVPMARAGRCASRGAFYVGPNHERIRPSEGVFAASAIAEIERLVLLAERAWYPVRALVAGAGEPVAAALDVPWVVEASDDACFSWASSVFLIFEHTETVSVRAATLESLMKALAACNKAGLRVELMSDAEPVAASAGPLFSGGSVAYRSATGLGRSIRVDPETDTIAELVGPESAPFSERRFIGGRPSVRRLGDGLSTLGGVLSPRAIAQLTGKGAVRDFSRTCSPERLKLSLLSRGLSAPEPVLAVEEQFGGLLIPSAQSPLPDLLLGTWQLMQLPPAALKNLRAVEAGEPFENGGRFPQGRYAGGALTLVGLELHEEQLLCDEDGVVLRLIPFIDFFEVESASVKGFLEQRALRWEVSQDIQETAELCVGADIGHRLSGRLQLSRVEEASDALVTHYRGRDHWVWRRAAYRPSIAATFAVTRTAAQMVEVAQMAQELSPGASMRLGFSRPGGPARFEALRKAGFTVKR